MFKFFYQLAIALDQVVNVLLGGLSGETLSARAHRMRVKRQKVWGWTAGFIDFLWLCIFRESSHCEDSYYSLKKGNNVPEEYRCKP